MRSVNRIQIVRAIVVGCALLVASTSAMAFSGAVYTTKEGCTRVNHNIYDSKADVYLSGGPGPGTGDIESGNYYVQVTTPDGTVLGKTNDPVPVTSGNCTRLIEILYTASSGHTVKGYDNTTNPGGEYKMWVSNVPDFQHSETKTDNFKVRNSCVTRPTPSVTLAINCPDDDDINCVGGVFQAPNPPATPSLVGSPIDFTMTVTSSNVQGARVEWVIYDLEALLGGNYNNLCPYESILDLHDGIDALGYTGTLGGAVLAVGSSFVPPGVQVVPVSYTPAHAGHVFINARATAVLDPTDACPLPNFGVDTASCWPTVAWPKVTATKFYDANLNGSKDSGECNVAPWSFTLTSGSSSVPLFSGVATEVQQPVGTSFTVCEVAPTNWLPTAGLCRTGTLNGSNSVFIGNVALGGGGGLTKGFWSNKNGQSLTTSADLLALSALNLRNSNGTNYDPATKASLSSFLTNDTNASNMANMLSAQLAAMWMNTHHNPNRFAPGGLGVSGASLIRSPGVAAAAAAVGVVIVPSNKLFFTVDEIITLSNAALANPNGLTVQASPMRTYQEALKNALDRANNNLNFLLSGPPTPYSCAP